VSIARSKLASTRELLELGIEKDWNALQNAWDAFRVSGQALEQAEVNVREVSDRHDAGMVPFSDLLEAQVLKQQARDRRTDAMAEYWLARSAYLRAIVRE